MKRLQTKLWADIGMLMPARCEIELRRPKDDGTADYLDFYAVTGEYDPHAVVEALKRVKAGEGGDRWIKNSHGVRVLNPDAIHVKSSSSLDRSIDEYKKAGTFSHLFPDGGSYLTPEPRRGLSFPWRKGDRVKLVSTVGSYKYNTAKLIKAIEGLVETMNEVTE